MLAVALMAPRGVLLSHCTVAWKCLCWEWPHEANLTLKKAYQKEPQSCPGTQMQRLTTIEDVFSRAKQLSQSQNYVQAVGHTMLPSNRS